MVTSVHLSPNVPSWIHPPHKRRTALWGWVLDERFRTFTVHPPEAPGPAPVRVKLSEEDGVQAAGTSAASEAASAPDVKLDVQVPNYNSQ